MSDTEHHTGKLIPLEQKETIEDTVKFHLRGMGVSENDIGDYTTSWLEYCKSELSDTYHIYNNKLYTIENTQCDDTISEANINDDGSINYRLLYYNGGCGFSEALDAALRIIQKHRTLKDITLFKYDDVSSHLKLSRCHAVRIATMAKYRPVYAVFEFAHLGIDPATIAGIVENVKCGDYGLVCDIRMVDTPMSCVLTELIDDTGTQNLKFSVGLISTITSDGICCDDSMKLIGVHITHRS